VRANVRTGLQTTPRINIDSRGKYKSVSFDCSHKRALNTRKDYQKDEDEEARSTEKTHFKHIRVYELYVFREIFTFKNQ
jgi:hypothetical protein